MGDHTEQLAGVFKDIWWAKVIDKNQTDRYNFFFFLLSTSLSSFSTLSRHLPSFTSSASFFFSSFFEESLLFIL